MKRRLLLFLPLALLLAACGELRDEPTVQGEMTTSAEAFTVPTTEPGSDSMLEIDPTLDPPLSEEELALPVPDFLNEEQQLLYRRANSLIHARWELGFGQYGSTTDDDDLIEVEAGPYRYRSITGRYRRWEDFRAVMASVFTDELFDELNTLDAGPFYIEHEGITCGIDLAPVNVIWTETDDTFELVRESDDCIEFRIIAYGVEPYEDDRVKITRTGSATMVKVEDGTWRVSSFHCPDCPDESISSVVAAPVEAE